MPSNHQQNNNNVGKSTKKNATCHCGTANKPAVNVKKAPTPKARTTTDSTPNEKPKTKDENKQKLDKKRAPRRKNKAEQKKIKNATTPTPEELAEIEAENERKAEKKRLAAKRAAERQAREQENEKECLRIAQLVRIPEFEEFADEVLNAYEDGLLNGKVVVADTYGTRRELTPRLLDYLFYECNHPTKKILPNREFYVQVLKNMIRKDPTNNDYDLNRTFTHNAKKGSDCSIIDYIINNTVGAKSSYTKNMRGLMTKEYDFKKWLSMVGENSKYRKFTLEYATAVELVTGYETKTYRQPLSKRKFILDVGPTNSGKTHSGIQELMQANSGVYLGPLRLLAMEVAENLNDNGVPCSMLTGEESNMIRGAKHIASTVEMLDKAAHYDVAVIDEVQMITDPDRGYAWAAAIACVDADVIHLCMAPEIEKLITGMLQNMGEEYEIVEHKRLVPLLPDKKISYPYDIQQGDAIVVFSRRSVQDYARQLSYHGIKASIIYGALPYSVRKEEVRKFAEGETQVVIATDAIGMGMNLPIKRVIFAETEKFDGTAVRSLKVSEIKQIAGRAGRYGKYDVGYVTAMTKVDTKFITNAIQSKTPNISTMRVDMPREILRFPCPMSKLMRAWQMNKLDFPYQKRDLTQQIKLARKIEDLPNDFVAEAVDIPFASNDHYLMLDEIWEKAVRKAAKGKKPPLTLYRIDDCDSMQYLENAIKVADLAYGIAKRYCTTEEIDKVDKERKKISEMMIERLKDNSGKTRNAKHNYNTDYSLCDYDDSDILDELDCYDDIDAMPDEVDFSESILFTTFLEQRWGRMIELPETNSRTEKRSNKNKVKKAV